MEPQSKCYCITTRRNEILEEAYFKDKLPLEDRGILHGEIIAIKDLANAKGFRTTQGSPIFAKDVASKDDLVVARIRAPVP